MRWLPFVLFPIPALGADLHCLAVQNYVCDLNGCEPTSLMATTVDISGDRMTACTVTGCNDFIVETTGPHLAFPDSDVPSLGSLVAGTLVIVSQYALIVQMAYYECSP